MSSAKQNRQIARLIIGAMTIDGSLSKDEQQRVAKNLEHLGRSDLIADVGIAIEEDDGTFDLFQECKDLLDALGDAAETTAPNIFRVIAEVVAHDRFVSLGEATYLHSLSRRLKLAPDLAKRLFRQVLAIHKSRLEISGDKLESELNAQLKEFLSFEGATELIGAAHQDSLQEMLASANEIMAKQCEYSAEDVQQAIEVLGISRTASLPEAEAVWKDTIKNLGLPKLADLGETYVTPAIARIAQINQAYRTILLFRQHVEDQRKAQTEHERLSKQIERESAPSTRNTLSGDLEQKMTGIGTNSKPPEPEPSLAGFSRTKPTIAN